MHHDIVSNVSTFCLVPTKSTPFLSMGTSSIRGFVITLGILDHARLPMMWIDERRACHFSRDQNLAPGHSKLDVLFCDVLSC